MKSQVFREVPVGRIGLAMLFGLAAGRLPAQSLLYVQDSDNAWQLVRDVRETTPMVLRDGKLKALNSDQFRLREVDEYAPFFISIQHLRVGDWYEKRWLLEGEIKTNDGLQVRGEFESAYPLDRVFLALELYTPERGTQLFIQQIGTFAPNVPISVFTRAPIAPHLGRFRCKIHLFSGGLEVLHSRIPFADREHALDRMVVKRIEGVKNAQPKPFVGPAAAYPPTLYDTKANGTAKIRMRIGRNGAVVDPAVESASDPAFGEAALAAIRVWRFLPKIQDGHPVESDAEMPFNFRYHPLQL